MLEERETINTWNCETGDLYWSNVIFDGMSEVKSKKYVRYRMVRSFSEKDYNGDDSWMSGFQNYQIFDFDHEDKFMCDGNDFNKYEKILEQNGWKMMFDTYKKITNI